MAAGALLESGGGSAAWSRKKQGRQHRQGHQAACTQHTSCTWQQIRSNDLDTSCDLLCIHMRACVQLVFRAHLGLLADAVRHSTASAGWPPAGWLSLCAPCLLWPQQQACVRACS